MTGPIRETPPSHDLRTRYFPKSRLGHGFIAAVPWLNVFLLFFFFFWLHDRMVLQPGNRLTLTQAPLSSATRSNMAMVLQRLNRGSQGEEALLYFDDSVYKLAGRQDRLALRTALAEKMAVTPDPTVVLYVDASFTMNIVQDVIQMARDAGVHAINLATQPELTVEGN